MPIKKFVFGLFLNILAFPGAGQWHVQERKRSLYFILPTLFLLLCVCYFVVVSIQKQIADIAHVSQANIMNLSQSLSNDFWVENDTLMKFFGFMLIGCYVASIADLIWLFQKSHFHESH